MLRLIHPDGTERVLPLEGLRCEQVHRPANLVEEAVAFAVAAGEPWARKVACSVGDYVTAGCKGDATKVLLPDREPMYLVPDPHVPPRILLTDKEWV